MTSPYRELPGQLLSNLLQQGVGGLLGAEQDQLHGPVSLQEETFRQEADSHHAFEDTSRGTDTAVKINPQMFKRGWEEREHVGPALGPQRAPGMPEACWALCASASFSVKWALSEANFSEYT